MDATGLPSDDTAEMLRDSLRGFLEAHWAAGAGKERPSPDDISAIWRKLIGQGVAALGASRDEGGLREILVVMAELGRAACPAPMWSTALANLALSGSRADAAEELLEKLHAGTAVAAFSFGACDPDAGAGSIRIDGSARNRRASLRRGGRCHAPSRGRRRVPPCPRSTGCSRHRPRADARHGRLGALRGEAEFGAADACFRSKAPISTISASRPR